MAGYVHDESEGEMFTRSRELFEALVAGLADPATGALAHTDLEDQLATSGRELMCALFQDHLDLRAAREDRCGAVIDAEGYRVCALPWDVRGEPRALAPRAFAESPATNFLAQPNG